MYTQQLECIEQLKENKHPYITKLALSREELLSLLKQETEFNGSWLDNRTIRRGGIRITSTKSVLAEVNIFARNKGLNYRVSPFKINAGCYSKILYGAHPETRVQFEAKEVIEDYNKEVEEGRLIGSLYYMRGGLNKGNPVRIFMLLYKNGGEITQRQLTKELELGSSHYFKTRKLEPMEAQGLIEIDGKIIRLSVLTKMIWNKENFKVLDDLKSSSIYKQLLSLNLRYVEQQEKVAAELCAKGAKFWTDRLKSQKVKPIQTIT